VSGAQRIPEAIRIGGFLYQKCFQLSPAEATFFPLVNVFPQGH
jgi:hypothetical protein